MVDYGCMCFDSLVYASRLSKKIVGINPSYEKLNTLQKRLVEEDVKNCDLVNANYNEQHFKEVFDCVIINSFLEQLLIEIRHNKSIYFNSRILSEQNDDNPEKIRIKFLQTVSNGLRPDGMLYLSYAKKVENQYLCSFC